MIAFLFVRQWCPWLLESHVSGPYLFYQRCSGLIIQIFVLFLVRLLDFSAPLVSGVLQVCSGLISSRMPRAPQFVYVCVQGVFFRVIVWA